MLSNYQNKKVFVTGHTGFKGSWLVKILSMLGADIKGYALIPDTGFNLYSILNIDRICESVIGDLRDRNQLIKEISDFQPDYIFHLAAQAIVRTSYEIPSETFNVNAIGTANVLDGLRTLKKPCSSVFITTDKVYQNHETGQLYKEDDRLGGYDPYSASKACAEIVIDSYRNSYFSRYEYSLHQKAIFSARAGNVIGGGDWARDRLIPDIIRSLSSLKDVELRNPDSIRPWQHVLEPLIGYLILGQKGSSKYLELSNAYNFGPQPQDTLTVKNIVKLAIEVWGGGGYILNNLEKQPHEAGLLHLDIERAEKELAWEPRWNAKTAINKTIEWYKHFISDSKTITEFTEAQIKEYIG